MDEFELASLALQQASAIREQVTLTQAQLEVISNAVAIQIQMIFGYLVVSYLIGKNLNRVQLSILNSIYIWFSVNGILSIIGAHDAGRFQYAELLVIDPDRGVPRFWQESTVYIIWMSWTLVLIASLWFMWETRNRSEQADPNNLDSI